MLARHVQGTYAVRALARGRRTYHDHNAAAAAGQTTGGRRDGGTEGRGRQLSNEVVNSNLLVAHRARHAMCVCVLVRRRDQMPRERCAGGFSWTNRQHEH